MAHYVIYKRPVEAASFTFNFDGLLTASDTGVDPNRSFVQVFDSSGADKTSLIIQPLTGGSQLVSFPLGSPLIMVVTLVNGFDPEDYLINGNGVGNISGVIVNRILELRVRTRLAGNL